MMMRPAIACTAFLMIFGAAACGGDDDTDTTPIVPLPDTSEGDVDPGDAGDGTSTDAAVDTTNADADAQTHGDGDVGPSGCTIDDDCAGTLDVKDCQDIVCEIADGEETGECVAVETDDCCHFTSDCIGVVEPGKCEQVSCVELECIIVEKDNCCTVTEDCQHLADGCCSEAICDEFSQCQVNTAPFCCETSDDCDDGNPVTTDQCVNACEADGCQNLAGPCDLQAVFVKKDFDDGTLGLLSVFDDDPTDNVSVSAVKHTAVSPGWSAYFGDPACHTYYDGPMVDCEPSKKTADENDSIKLTLKTQQFTMDPDAGAFLGFWVNMSAEEEQFIPSIGYYAPDYLRVVVNDGSQNYTVWKSTDEDAVGGANTTNGEWLFQVADLSPFTNKAIEVSFEFIADDTDNYNISAGINSEEKPWVGAYVDSIRIMAICEEGTCEVDEDCPNDFNGCTTQTCSSFTQGSGGVCAYEASTPGQECQGCSQVGDCGNDPCFDYACTDSVCEASKKPECCAPSSSFPEETVEPSIAYEGFEGADALTGWEIEDPYDDNVSWQVSGINPFMGSSSLYFGNGFDFAAEPDNPSEATLWTSWFEVDSDPFRTPVLSFWLYLDTEYTGASSAVECEFEYDQLTIWATTKDGQSQKLWNSCDGAGDDDTSDDLGNTTLYLYEQVGVDLTVLAGEEVRLGFKFDSGGAIGMPGVGNDGEGVFIDDLTVTSICDAACITSTDCEDGDACTDDVCDLGQCVNTQDNPNCCTAADDCDDGNECTIESCENSLCASNYEAPPVGSDDGLIACCSESAWLDGWTEDFESGLGGFNVESNSGTVAWHVTGSMGQGGGQSANFSDPATGNYDDVAAGGPVTGRLISPPVHVPPYGQGASFTDFWFAMSTEWDDNDPSSWEAASTDLNGDGIPDFKIDELQVMVMVNGLIGQAESHWASWYVTNTTYGEWAKSRVDLADYAGDTVQLVFEFTADNSNDKYPGVFIDNISFGTTCLPSGAINCMYGGDCASSDECKVGVCSDTFKCLEEPKATAICCEPYEVEAMTLGFEGGSEEWSFETECGPGQAAPNSPIDEASMWSLGTNDNLPVAPKVDDQSLYFGNGVDYGGSNNGISCGDAVSPTITLEEGVPWTLDFWAYIDVETHFTCGVSPDFTDVFTLEVVDTATGDAEVVFTKPGNYQDQGGSNECSKYNKWYKPSVVLDDWAGKTIQLRFHFHTYDTFDNDGKGILIDDMVFTKGCADIP